MNWIQWIDMKKMIPNFFLIYQFLYGDDPTGVYRPCLSPQEHPSFY